MALELVPFGTADIRIAEPIVLADGPQGTRLIIEVVAAEYSGERFRAKLKGAAAGDWLQVSPRGIGTLDVRITLETDDGALLYATYRGRVDVSKGVEGAVVYSTPLFETGDERYQWMNAVQFVAKGVVSGDSLHYDIFELR